MLITGSPDITSLQVQVTFDLSGTAPAIVLQNLSAGSGLQKCSWAFTAYSPSLTPIHSGNVNTPDIAPQTTPWGSYTLTDPWPLNPFNNYQVEWSGSPYQFFVTVKDSVGNVYSTNPNNLQSANILPPPNVPPEQLSFYGIASSNVTTQCNNGAVFFQDITDFTYVGNAGTKISSTLIVSYPIDNTGNRQSNFSLIAYSSALVPVTINSANYQFVQKSVYDYDFGNYVHVRLGYVLNGQFGVWCGINMLPLNAVINKFFYKVANNEFADMASAQKRAVLMLAEYVQITTGILQPLAGAWDIPNHILRIEQLSGFQCFDACCGAQSGIIPQQITSVIGGYNFSVNKLGGDINPITGFSTNGNNITLNIGDVTYTVTANQISPSQITAISVVETTSGGGYLRNYNIEIDGTELALNLATIIGGNPTLYNIWNNLFGSNGSFKVSVDGACVFSTSVAYNYVFGLTNIPVNTTYAILGSLTHGQSIVALNFSFNQTNLPDLQTYLNSLGLGTYTVTNVGGGAIQIASSDNIVNIDQLTYSVNNINYVASINKYATGYQEKDAQEILQDLIYAFCALQDTGVKTSAAYTICYLDATGTPQTTVVSAGTNLSVFISALLQAGCTTISYLQNNGGGVNCSNLKSVFKTNANTVDANTLLYGYKGTCAGLTFTEMIQWQLKNMDATTLQLFCEAVAQCGAGKPCESISFNVLVTPVNTSCSSITGIKYLLS